MTARMKLGAALFVGCLACPTPARATEPTPSELQAARELFARAEKDEDAARWEAALDKLQRAASVKTTPGLRFHIALCEEKLGRLVDALHDYNASEVQARQSGNREVLDTVTESIATLRARIPSLTVSVPLDAKTAAVMVTVDGAPLASELWGTAFPVDVGPHTVRATADNRVPFSATVSTLEREAKVVDVRLLETTPASLVASVSQPASLGPTPHPVKRTGAVVASAGTIALVGVGVASFLVAGARQSDARSECAARTSCNDLKLPIQALDWVALGAWVGAAAVGTIAVVLWVTPAPSSAEKAGERGADRSASVLLLPGSLRLQGTF